MRTTLLSSILIAGAAATPALADNPPQQDTGTVPTSCQWIGDPQAQGQPAPQQLAAKASMANCTAIATLDGLSIEPTQDGVQAVDAAIEPSITMLDGVIGSGDIEAQIVATQAKADLLQGAAVKLESTLQPVGTMKGKDLAAYDKRVDQTAALAAPFRQRAADTFQQLATMTQSTDAQQLAVFDPVVAGVVHDPRLSPSQISTREPRR